MYFVILDTIDVLHINIMLCETVFSKHFCSDNLFSIYSLCAVIY